MAKKAKLTKTETWLKGQARQGAKLRDLLPTVSQYKRMDKSLQRKYTRIMMDWKSKSPSVKARALDRMQKYFYRIPGKTAIQSTLGERIRANLETVFQHQQEEYMYSIEEFPGGIYRQGKAGSGYGFSRWEHFKTDKKGRVVGGRTAKEVSKLMLFKKMDRDQLTVSNGEMKEYLDGVEFYDDGAELVAVAKYGSGDRRFIDIYNKSTDSTETIEVDLTRKGYPRNKIDWESPAARRRDDTTGWG
jgi:hypothetical protein|nr:MAG TPA: hypothetical protein [Caudoviricetes sp.]